MEEDMGSVSIETVILNDEHGGLNDREIEFSIMGSCAWMNPQIEWY